MLKAFDAPSREECTAQRPRSNTPLEALVLLNDHSMIEAAVAMAARILATEENDEDRLRNGFRLATARWPDAVESAALKSFLDQQWRNLPSKPKRRRGVGWIRGIRGDRGYDRTGGLDQCGASDPEPVRNRGEKLVVFDSNDSNRRTFLSSCGLGVGSAALSTLLAKDSLAAASSANPPGRAGLPHHPPRIKRVIFLCMAGGPSHLETFDYKPELAKLDGQPMPESFTEGQPIAQLQGQAAEMPGPLNQVRPVRKSRVRRSAIFLPWHQKMADDICIDSIDGHRTDQPRSGPHVHEHRHGDQWPAVDGIVDHLRAGQRKRRSARVCRADQRGWPQSTADRLATMVERFSAQPLSGRRIQ